MTVNHGLGWGGAGNSMFHFVHTIKVNCLVTIIVDFHPVKKKLVTTNIQNWLFVAKNKFILWPACCHPTSSAIQSWLTRTINVFGRSIIPRLVWESIKPCFNFPKDQQFLLEVNNPQTGLRIKPCFNFPFSYLTLLPKK